MSNTQTMRRLAQAPNIAIAELWADTLNLETSAALRAFYLWSGWRLRNPRWSAPGLDLKRLAHPQNPHIHRA